MDWSGKHTLAAVAIAGVAAAFFWASRSGGLPALTLTPSTPAAASPGASQVAQAAASGAAAVASAANGANDPFLTPNLRHRFEEMIQEALAGGTPTDPEVLKSRLLALVARQFLPEQQARASQLAGRYVDYRVALGKIAAPADPTDPHALRMALDARQKIQRQYFTGEEYDVFFAKEAELDRYTLARLEIERNPALTPAQKDAALRAADRELGETERAERSAALQHMDAAAQTAGLNARNAGDAERYAAREASFGQAAATELAKLDREERDWQSRLSEYARVRGSLTPEQLQQFRDARFTVQEQMRLEAALALRGANPP